MEDITNTVKTTLSSNVNQYDLTQDSQQELSSRKLQLLKTREKAYLSQINHAYSEFLKQSNEDEQRLMSPKNISRKLK